MLHIYTYPSKAFQDWLKAANQLYLTQHLYQGGRKKDYRPLQQQLNPQSQDQYLLYIDDQMGICGSAILTPLPHEVQIEGQLIPQGTWALGHVLFCAKAHVPIHHQIKTFDRVITHFHERLFDHLWHLSQASGHQMALSFQNDPAIHQDLTFFGGFTCQAAKYLDDDPQNLSVALISLTATTYQVHTQTKQKNLARLETDPYSFVSQSTDYTSEVTL